MVNRVGNGPGYEYTRVNEQKINNNATGTGEKFQLDYGKEGAIYEPSSEALNKQKADKTVTSSNSKTVEPGKEENTGVKLTLSNAGIEKAETAKSETTSFIDTLTGWTRNIFDRIKGIFSSIWNDTDEQVSTTDNQVETTQKPKSQFEKAKAEADAFLASTEGKKVARNSDLLTYYDRHGMVVSVSASDKQKILYGDKNHIDV